MHETFFAVYITDLHHRICEPTYSGNSGQVVAVAKLFTVLEEIFYRRYFQKEHFKIRKTNG